MIHFKESIYVYNCLFVFLFQVPAHLCTSPLTLEFPQGTTEAPEGSFSAGSGTRRKKRRRKRMRSDTHLREDASSSSEEREKEKEEWERECDQPGQESPAQEELLTPLQMRSVAVVRATPLQKERSTVPCSKVTVVKKHLFLIVSLFTTRCLRRRIMRWRPRPGTLIHTQMESSHPQKGQ